MHTLTVEGKASDKQRNLNYYMKFNERVAIAKSYGILKVGLRKGNRSTATKNMNIK